MPTSLSSQAAPLAVTMGEPAGIGGEITLKAWAAGRRNTAVFFVVDDAERLKTLARTFAIPCPIVPIAAPHQAVNVFRDGLPVLPPLLALTEPVTLGTPRPAHAKAVIAAIDHAVALVMSGAAG